MLEKRLYSDISWSVFSHIWTVYGGLLYKFAYSVQMRGNTDLENCEYGHFLGSAKWQKNKKKSSVEKLHYLNVKVSKLF